MGKKLKFFIALFIFRLFPVTAFAGDEQAASIEQVFVQMPEITIYGSNFNIDDGVGMEAYLAGETIQLTQKLKFSESGEEVYYYLLLDVSNSMPDTYFENIKEGILKFEESLGPGEHMVLYTFGQEVTLVLDENHDKGQSVQVLSGIENTDNRTLLFEAIRRASDDSLNGRGNACKRKIIMVISDGEDFATGETMSNEALENIKKKGIPAYAFGIEATARENLNSFGEFSRMSGGRFTIFNEQQAAQVLFDFHQAVQNSDVLWFQASSNLVSNRMETLSLNLLSLNQTLTRDVMISRWIPDTAPPQVMRSDYMGGRQIEIEFSEPVNGSGLASGYSICKGEQMIPVTAVNAESENTVILTAGEDLKPGSYEISCPGVRDVSMEENRVSNVSVFTVEKAPFGERLLRILKSCYWIFILLIVTVFTALILIFYRKLKKSRGILYVEGKPVMASETEIHKHVAIQEKEGKPFFLTVSVGGNYPENMTLSMIGSFIVGRSKMSSLYIDDRKMSRQHFALEWDGQNMYVMDLDTTNGTMVNDVQIKKRYKLQQGDEIAAGSVKFKIRW